MVILVSAVLVLSCGQTDRITESHIGAYTDADDRYTHTTPVAVSN